MERFLKIAVLVATLTPVMGQGILQPWESEGAQCIGTPLDFSRLRSLEVVDISTLADLGFFETEVNSYGFAARQVSQVKSPDGTCLAERHRLRELKEGIPIFGADFVVTTEACTDENTFDRSALIDTNTLVALDETAVLSVNGYVLDSVRVPTGYTPKHSTREEALAMVAGIYGVPEDKVTTLTLEIFPTADVDYRAWVGTVLVENTPGQSGLYQVFVDDESEEVIFQCEIGGFGRTKKQEKMKKRTEGLRRRLQSGNTSEAPSQAPSLAPSQAPTQQTTEGTEYQKDQACQRCPEEVAYGSYIEWDTSKVVDCDIQTLYLNNTALKGLCINGTDSSGDAILGPGPVPQYHWGGTLDCNSRTTCQASYVASCPDAASDVQWGAINFFRYLREHLGVEGGLVKDAANPIPAFGRVHYDIGMCNAFYTPGEHHVSFGDCDCSIFYPLVSTDVVVHEITHGLTSESSNLLYIEQSGGMNEAFSDIMAAAVEFDTDDGFDPPDFLVGEVIAGDSLGREFLRNMENPSADGQSIETNCDFQVGMGVHHSSGFLNRAYVRSVRACESTCGSTAECAILIANTFMYTNMETLSMTSGFRDAAKAICLDVRFFFAERNPQTSCTVAEVKSAISVGFDAVGVNVNDDTCYTSVKPCGGGGGGGGGGGPISCISAVGQFLSRFFN